MTISRRAWPWCLAAAALAASAAGPARADVIGPPQAVQCGPGQEVVTDHGGTRCQYRYCRSPADCPPPLACVARSETYCDPRGQPCQTSVVQRCTPAGTGPGGTPVSPRRPGCACRAGGEPGGAAGAFWLAAAAALVMMARRRS
ncbi:MAG: hypothetical protein HY744_03265 [Deltaproteobacteria bacterium]|nr:hypothetical protein [Deltaproteobacteria bacterium]